MLPLRSHSNSSISEVQAGTRQVNFAATAQLLVLQGLRGTSPSPTWVWQWLAKLSVSSTCRYTRKHQHHVLGFTCCPKRLALFTSSLGPRAKGWYLGQNCEDGSLLGEPAQAHRPPSQLICGSVE